MADDSFLFGGGGSKKRYVALPTVSVLLHASIPSFLCNPREKLPSPSASLSSRRLLAGPGPPWGFRCSESKLWPMNQSWHALDGRAYCRPAKKALPKKEDKEAFLARTQVNTTGLTTTGNRVAMIPCSFSRVGCVAQMKISATNRCDIPAADTSENCRYHGQTSMLQPRTRGMFR
jgi:hypothetical protein